MDFDRRMEAMLEGLANRGDKPRLLLHCCCAPCSTAVIERLAERLAITLYYYNPNIDSAGEHALRAQELSRLAGQADKLQGTVICEYDSAAFAEAVRGLEQHPEGGARCEACFKLRLRQSARYAAAQGFDLYTTTLTISPMKNAALLNALGEQIGREEGVAFLNSDFKKRGGYQRSTELSKALGLYRQDYCGCVYSRRERDERLRRRAHQ